MNRAETIAEREGIELHEPHWTGPWAFQLLVFASAFCLIGLGFCAHYGNYWVAVPLSFVAGHLIHGLIIGLHEASHGLLRKNRAFNEFDGILIATLGLMSFSLYRAAHQSHHAYLASERDDELWPFVLPGSPRWARRLAAFLELTLGMFYTPFLFLRAFLRPGSKIRNKAVRRRIWWELGLLVLLWSLILLVVALNNWWGYLLWMYFIPTFIATNMQSLRKYIEHIGLNGNTPTSSTRSIVSDSWAGKLVAFTLLHEPYHGVHHRHSGLPHPVLPQYKEILTRKAEDLPPFPSYTSAFLHLLRCLRDPQVGAQWLAHKPLAKSPEMSYGTSQST